MVIEKYQNNFYSIYDELTGEVLRAMFAFAPQRLQEWFAHLDGEPEAARAIMKLETGLNFSQWYAIQGRRPKPGSPKLDWPPDNDQRLGMQLLLFRSIAREDTNIGLLGKTYVPGSGTNINDNTRAFTDQVFRPMTKELVRYLRRVGQAEAEGSVPAADRVVDLTHNSASLNDVADALEKLAAALRSANDYEDDNDKQQRIAEVEATKTLIKAPRVQGRALAFVKACLTYLAKKFADVSIGKIAALIIEKLAEIVGHLWSLL
jgi:hypothetical protein